jgi:hypothetical protein
MRPVPFGLACVLLAAAIAVPAAAADFTITLPNVSGSPGSLVDIPIQMSAGPAGYDILSIDFRLALDPAFTASPGSKPDGFLGFWGSPFVHGTSSYLAAAAAGTTPITSTGTLVNTVQVYVAPHATPGTTLPLTFEHFLFNEGSPTVAIVPGSLHVDATPASASQPAAATLALALASRNPVRGVAALSCSLPAAGAARLAIHAIDGRLVRGTALAGSAGSATWSWDLRDARGTRVRPGVYLASLDAGGARRTVRIVVAE